MDRVRVANGRMLLSANVCTQMNSPSFISRLPSELLASIFILYADDSYRASRPRLSSLNAPDWVNVSYVCRHWRNIALKCPTLWSFISMTMSPRWTEVLLARSKHTPLKIYFKISREDNLWWPKFVKKLMDHVERIQEFRLLFLCWDTEAHRISSKLFSRASRLQFLEMELSMNHYRTGWGSDINVPAPWHSFKLDGLTSLTLDGFPFSFQLDVVEFQAMLSHMRGLTQLHLDSVLASPRHGISGTEFSSSLKVDLPCLSHLLIIERLSAVNAFLSGVNVPARTKITLECRSEDSFDHYTQFFSILAQHYSKDRGLDVPTIRSMVMNPEEVYIVFSASECYRHPPHSAAPLKWDLSIPVNLKIVVRVSVLCRLSGKLKSESLIASNICSVMPLTHVQRLHVIDPPFCAEFWSEMLGYLPGLRSLKLGGGLMPDLASALRSRTADKHLVNQNGHASGDRDACDMLAPALEELELECIQFLDRSKLRGMNDWRREPAADIQSLYAALSSRKGPRGRLILSRCDIHGDHRMEYDIRGWWEGGRVETHDLWEE